MPDKSAAELARLISAPLVGDPARTVDDVTHDSRMAGDGVLFVAVRGAVHDGHDYVDGAVEAGSPVICVDRQMATSATQILADEPRQVMGILASAVHGHPSDSISVLGVTGTNGKTTVTHFIESIANSAGLSAGLIGTIRTSVGGKELARSPRTTPEAPDFQRLLAAMRDSGADLVATEVSSHALELGRVRGTIFAVAAFTNLSRDHLDFHREMASYRHAKERLFRDYELGAAVINIDDPVGRDIASWVEAPVTTVGLGGDIDVSNLVTDSAGTTFDLRLGGRLIEVKTSVVGPFNVRNLVMAGACLGAIGVDERRVIAAMSSVPGVPGRFELVSGSAPIGVIIDYAHTPEGIELAIDAGRQMATGKIIAVVGAGGDRDREKRPLMGAAAAAADLVVVTNDNPRSEDPSAIAQGVREGIPPAIATIVELDRRRAIERAIEEAVAGDLVLVLGKGHETGQEIAGTITPFSDRAVARELLGMLERSVGSDPEPGGGLA